MRRREFITLLGGAAQDSRILQPASPNPALATLQPFRGR
jgi:hypothetical protein